MISGDLRPPLIQGAFNKRVTYTWDEIDLGMPSVYQPRILIPSYFFVTVFQNLGMDLYSSQLTTVFLMYFIASILMYVYVKQLTNGDIITAFIAALFLTSNIYLISDREQTAIGFIDTILMILPSVVTFTEGIRKKSYAMLTLSGLLFVLTYGTFPNYRAMFLCFATSMLTLLFMYVNNGLNVHYEKNRISGFLNISLNMDLMRTYLKYVIVSILALFLASIWIIAIVSANFHNFVLTYGQMASTPSVLKYIQFHDILRLIAKWGFYSSALDSPYVPYADIYLHNSLFIALSYLPPILAFASVLTPKSRRLTIYFSGIALFSLILVSGVIPELYSALVSYIPLLIVFRESAQWLFFTILSYSILIGIVSSTLYHRFRKKALQIITLSLIVIILFSSSYPLATGDVTRNWLNTNIKGSFFPNSYAELDNALSNEYWTLLLPQRHTYIVYNFTKGPLSCGNPYPLIFSKPIISGTGTEYVSPANLDLIDKLHELMLTNENIASEGKVSASSIEDVGFEPEKAVDGQFQTRWSSKKGIPQWLEVDWNQTQPISEISIVFEAAYAEDYRIETWNDTSWVTQIIVKNSTSYFFWHSFPHPIRTARLRLCFTKTTEVFPSISIWELEVYARNPGISKLLGMLGIKYLVLEKNITLGSTDDINRLDLNESENFVLAREWDEVALYSNAFALQKLYVSDNTVGYATLEDMCKIAENSQWENLQHSVFVNSSSADLTMNNTLALPDNFVWTEHSPTSYEAHTESKGAFMLVFLESYDPHWKLYVNGSSIPEGSHIKVNAYANGWVINDTGKLTIRVEYETQSLLTTSIVASIVLVALLLTLLSRRELRAIAHMVRNKFERKPSNT
jgi:hypothetical protein